MGQDVPRQSGERWQAQDGQDSQRQRLATSSVDRFSPFARPRPRYLPGRPIASLTARRGKKKAAVALGHSILVIVYHLLSRGEVYHDLGVQYFDEGRRERVQHGLVRRLQDLGYKVTLEPAQPTTSAA